MGLCQGPCEGKVSAAEYARHVRSIKLILEGKKDDLYRHLRADMEDLARRKDFEGAGRVRDQIRAIGALYSGTGMLIIIKRRSNCKGPWPGTGAHARRMF